MVDLISIHVGRQLVDRIKKQRRVLNALVSARKQLPTRSAEFIYRVSIIGMWEDHGDKPVEMKGRNLERLLRNAFRKFQMLNHRSAREQATIRVSVMLPRKAGVVELHQQHWENLLPA